jgi:hypothetical protein
MPLRALVTGSALAFAVVAGHNTLLQSEANHSPAISACSQGTSGAQEGCTPSSLGAAPISTVEKHQVLAGACPAGDLHVMHYTPGDDAAPLTASWCETTARGPD